MMKTAEKVQKLNTKIDKVYFWNTSAGLVNASQSFVFMFVITRACGLVEAGIFSFAFANANVFLCIGKYGMKKFQATDFKQEFTFPEYLASRVVTTFVMFSAIMLYAFTRNDEYSVYKIGIILVVGLLKTVDSFDDVFLGMFQQRKHLDIGARNYCIRNLAMISTSILAVILTRNLFWGFAVGFCISILLLGTMAIKSIKKIELHEVWKVKWNKVGKLLWINFPLVVGDFLTMYIINSPKYAIDTYLSEEIQAIYGILAQPVLIIALFSDFVFNPVLVNFSEYWITNNKSRFNKLLIRQFVLIGSFTVLVLLGGYFVGLPILSMVYSTELGVYKRELMILLLGGGLTAIYSFLYSLTACIRHQKAVIPIFGVVAAIAYGGAPYIVKSMELLGSALIYIGTAGILSIAFGCVVLLNIYNKKFFLEGNNG